MEESVCFSSLPEGNNQHHNHGRRETTNTTTMAVASENGPLPPHMKSNFRRIRVGLIGDNAPSKQICFSLAMSWSKALNSLSSMDGCDRPLKN